jgi:hypothetical protein
MTMGVSGSDGSQMDTNIYNGGVTDPYASTYGGYNTGGNTNPGATDTGGIYDPSASYNSYDQGSGWGDSSSGDNSGYSGYAQGGAVPDDQTTGGQVPQSASPSQGMQTDDVPAQLNAEEFVVPRDVARWKGEEFFQKLIDQSRKARVMGSAKGKPGAAAPQGAPAFASQAMGA